MKKFLLSLAAVALCASAGMAQGTATETWTLAKGNVSSFPCTFSPKDGITWTIDETGNDNLQNFDSTKGQQFGTGATPISKLIISSDSFSDKEITEIIINTSCAKSGKSSLSVKVGDNSLNNNNSSSYTLTTTATDVIFKPSSTSKGNISLEWTVSAKAIYVKSITVKYSVSTDTRKEAGLSYPEAEYSVNFSELDSFVAPVLNNPNNLTGIVYESSNEGPAHIDENTGALTLYRVAGTTTITASFKGNATYKPCTASYTLTVVDDRKDTGLSFPESEYTTNVGEAFNTPELTNPNGLTVSYSSSNTNVASVEADGVVTIVGAGTTIITAKFAGNDEFKESEASYTLKVVDPNVKELGTKENPYTVTDLKEMTTTPTGSFWVKGYIIGYMENNDFTAGSGSVVSNIVIGKSASTNSIDDAVPVQLTKDTAPRSALNVQDNKDNIGKGVMVYGSIEKYFSMTGVKNVTDYVLDTATGVTTVEVDANAPKEYYNLQGVRVANPEKGLYIVRQGGKVSKVIL